MRWRVLLEGAGVRVVFAICCKVLVAALRVACGLWSGHARVKLQGAVAGCGGVCALEGHAVLLSKGCALWSVPLQGPAGGCCCHSAVCALERAC